MDEWTDFKNRYYNNFQVFKQKIKITIFGSYYPPKEKEFLKKLKSKLITDGYINTILVEDKLTEEFDPLEISQMCMVFSDINILVFTRKGKRYGLIDELVFLATDPRMHDKREYSIIFDHNDGRSSIPDLSSSRIRNSNLRLRTFNNYNELEEIIGREIFWILREYVKKNK